MFVLTAHDNSIVHITDDLSNRPNGDYLVDHSLIYLQSSIKGIFEVDEIPSEVIPFKYKYANGEFALNPNWQEPVAPDDEDAQELLNIIKGVTE